MIVMPSGSGFDKKITGVPGMTVPTTTTNGIVHTDWHDPSLAGNPLNPLPNHGLAPPMPDMSSIPNMPNISIPEMPQAPAPVPPPDFNSIDFSGMIPQETPAAPAADAQLTGGGIPGKYGFMPLKGLNRMR